MERMTQRNRKIRVCGLYYRNRKNRKKVPPETKDREGQEVRAKLKKWMASVDTKNIDIEYNWN